MAKTATEDELDYTKYLDKEPTDLQARFGEWLLDKVGIQFGTKKETDAFMEGVRLATALRMPFQRSPENQAASPMVRANRSGGATKSTAKKSTRAKAQPEEEDVRPAKSAKKSVRRPATEESAEEPTRPARRPARRRAAAATTSTEEAPF